MAAVVIGEVDITEYVVACDACGACGHMTRETGDPMARVRLFARQHLDPRIVRARVVMNGLQIGWLEP
jgi:hypothetical protein